MNKLQKERLVSDIRDILRDKALVVVVRQSGVTVSESTQLRRDMRQQQAIFKVMKNTLLNIALQGTEFEGLQPFLTGPTALACSADPVGAAKVVVKFAENSSKMQVIGAWMGGRILDVAAVEALAKLPSMNELRAQILGLLAAPATKIVRTIKEPMSRVARVCAAKQ